MRVGDLVKMVRGYSEPGIVLKIDVSTHLITVHWPDHGICRERRSQLVVIS